MKARTNDATLEFESNYVKYFEDQDVAEVERKISIQLQMEQNDRMQ